MSKTKYGDLAPCLCGGEAKLVEYCETCDGRGDKHANITCNKCGIKLGLTYDEFHKAKHDFGYKGGYYSSNKKFWEGMHQRLIDKWNRFSEKHENTNLNTVGVKAEDIKVETFSNFLIKLIILAVTNKCKIYIETMEPAERIVIRINKRGLNTSREISKDELEMCPDKVWDDIMFGFMSLFHYYKTMQEEWDE